MLRRKEGRKIGRTEGLKGRKESRTKEGLRLRRKEAQKEERNQR